jgi:hypothetical protein
MAQSDGRGSSEENAGGINPLDHLGRCAAALIDKDRPAALRLIRRGLLENLGTLTETKEILLKDVIAAIAKLDEMLGEELTGDDSNGMNPMQKFLNGLTDGDHR